MPDVESAARVVFNPKRPQASPLFQLVSDDLQRLQTGYDDRFATGYGPWRPVVTQVADKFLASGVLDHGCTRIRCDACTHENLLAFSCKCRSFRPGCHAKRLTICAQSCRRTAPGPSGIRTCTSSSPTAMAPYHRRMVD